MTSKGIPQASVGTATPTAAHIVPGRRTADLEMHRRGIGAEGADMFLWPLPPLDYWPGRDAIATSLVSAARAELPTSSLATDALCILIVPLFLEALSIYTSQRIVEAFKHIGYDVLPPARGRVLQALATGTAPPKPRLMYWLNVGPEVPRNLRAPVRFARDLVIQKHILRRILRPIDLARDIVSTSVDALPELHASRVDERVVYQRWHVWFDPQTAKPSAEHQRLANRAVDAIAAGFATTGTPFDAVCADGLRAWLAEAISLVEAHCAGIARRSALPRRLWTGSGGIVWNRILQWAVRAAGGTAVGHDHGSGVGHVAPEIYRTMFEYETADHFATFTASQAEGHKALFSPQLLTAPRTVNVQGVADGRSARIRASRKPTGRPRKVMLLSSYYFGDVVTCEGFVPDLPMLDFEVRLIAELKRRGYEVIYKPHPLIVTRPPHDMAVRLGAVELARPSEEVLH
ncbi:MAG: hypothetical protein HY543_06645, partial [Deltaproteobacteria bacterium]|nr:hypothetical protein [Deltaproteobacteria bacterium]